MADSPAFNVLLDIEKRSRAHAAGLPQKVETREIWSGVGFSLAGNKFVVPINEVAEILHVPRFTQVPGVQPWVKGVANVRGRLMPVLDLMSYLDHASDFPMKRRRLLVLEHGEFYSGLMVDAILGMQHFAADQAIDQLPGAYQSTRSYLRGAFQKGDGIWAVFSLHALAQDPAFMNVAS